MEWVPGQYKRLIKGIIQFYVDPIMAYYQEILVGSGSAYGGYLRLLQGRLQVRNMDYFGPYGRFKG